ncbi:MAG: 6-bladed beta-propeller [Ignavibacteria bacterium]|nr:6-bladed beta-propeller [Ignavibacteria bacterium]
MAQNFELISVEAGMKNKGTLKLSDLIIDIKYIPLETKNEFLISYIDKIIISDKLIFLKNHQPPALYVFERSGKFVTKVGTRGKGPLEYNYIRSFCIDERNNQIFIYAAFPHKLLIFNYSGIFDRKYECSSILTVNDMEFFTNEKYIVMYGNPNGTTPFSYETYMSNNKLIGKNVKPVSYSNNGSFGLIKEFSHYIFNNSLFVKENVLNDTLYKVSSSSEFIPYYVFNFGKYEFLKDIRVNPKKYLGRNINNYIVMNNMFETKQYLFYSYSLDNRNFLNYYDKYKIYPILLTEMAYQMIMMVELIFVLFFKKTTR